MPPPVLGVELALPPPKRPPDGFSGALPPKRPPDAGVVDAADPPKSPPLAGAGVPVAGVAAGFAPKRPPPLEGAGDAPKRPAPPVLACCWPPPNSPPGFGASAGFCPNNEPPVLGVDEAGAADPKLRVGVPEPEPEALLAPAFPKSEPPAGAVDGVPLLEAPEVNEKRPDILTLDDSELCFCASKEDQVRLLLSDRLGHQEGLVACIEVTRDLHSQYSCLFGAVSIREWPLDARMKVVC